MRRSRECYRTLPDARSFYNKNAGGGLTEIDFGGNFVPMTFVTGHTYQARYRNSIRGLASLFVLAAGNIRPERYSAHMFTGRSCTVNWPEKPGFGLVPEVDCRRWELGI